jgi:hypothetical protein
LRVVAALLAAVCVVSGCSPAAPPAQSSVAQSPLPAAQAPKQAVKLVFVHHSCGENWLNDSHGGLGKALAENNYFVSDTNYGWGPDSIGDRTDITDWPEWFTGPRSRKYLQALYRENGQHCEYTRTATELGGENRVVMFKSCFPNSNLEGKPTDRAARGEGLTVANAEAIYEELLGYFATRPDRLFIAVTAPPVQDSTNAANARAFNRWLVENWLADYRGNNVAVFDFYNVLTGPENHHRLRNGQVEYTCQPGKNTLYYPSDGDDHPSPAGNQKATEEFIPLLNAWYSKWAAAKPQAAEEAKPPVEAAPESPPAEESAPIETSEKPVPPVTTSAGKSIDDFEGDPKNWAVFLDEGKETRLSFALNKEAKHNGAASLQIQYDLAPESWAACSLVHDRPQDWSGSGGLSFYLHAGKAGEPITVIAYGGKSPEDLLNFECTFKAGQAAVDGWQRIDLAWSQLRLPEWQGDATQKYDPRSAMGVGFTFHSAGDGRRTARVWIDDVSLIAPGK